MNKNVIVASVVSVAALVGTVAWTTQAGASKDTSVARTVLRAPDGDEVGKVWFYNGVGGRALVRVRFDAADASTAVGAFHGLHVHANDVAANGEGCVADPAQAASTWFVSADGHWKAAGQDHASHIGDLPSVYAAAGGAVEAWFQTDRFAAKDAIGRAVVVHAGPDNFGNVPTGDLGYTANSTGATAATANTGNAGARVACGVVTKH
jgi:superoxide dismutase, Cu-Zn family